MEPLFETVAEDADLLVINKPADLVCHPTKGDAYSSLISRVRLYLGPASEAHMINRLDRETSGLVVVAKRLEAAVALRQIWESRNVRKEYWAIVHGHVPRDGGVVDARLGKDGHSRVAIKDCVRPDGAEARTEFFVEKRFSNRSGDFSLLRVVPLTGRKHQIRIHLAYAGHPIVGDKLYGGDEDVYLALVERRLTDDRRRQLLVPHHALHARSLRFQWRGEERVFGAEPEAWFTEFAASVGQASSLSPV